ncbi:MAG: hypothetical protein HYZ54_09630 [Ignavibacteriae bacterium]|nr:hypothetical protein [Ignavibacteriota bacterium]
MSYFEKSVALAPDEIEKLRKSHRAGTIMSLFILIIIVGAATFFFNMGRDFLPFRIFAPIFAIIGLGIVIVNFYQQRKDIQGGVKTIISGVIEDKKETHSTGNSSRSSDSYKFIMGDKEIEVNSSNYSKFHVKDHIEITKLPHAGTILDICLIESSTGINGKQLSNTRLDGSPLHDARSISAPSFSESSYPLDANEEQYLRRTRNKRAVRSFKWVLIPVWIFLFFKYLAVDTGFTQFLYSFSLSIPLFIVLLPLIIQALRVPRLISPYNRDIESGMKIICRTTVTDKFHGIQNRSAFYSITVNDKQYSVPEDFYNKIEAGEEITLNYAEHSKTEFSIQSTQDRTKFIAFYT